MALGLFIRDGGNVQREISELVIRDGTNTARTISELWIRDEDNVPRLVFNPSGSGSMAVGVIPVGASGFDIGSGTVTTNVVTATATGGTGPYTYAWTLESYSSISAPPTAVSPATAATAFTQTGMSPDTIETSEWICTATDSLLNTAASDLVPANFAEGS